MPRHATNEIHILVILMSANSHFTCAALKPIFSPVRDPWSTAHLRTCLVLLLRHSLPQNFLRLWRSQLHQCFGWGQGSEKSSGETFGPRPNLSFVHEWVRCSFSRSNWVSSNFRERPSIQAPASFLIWFHHIPEYRPVARNPDLKFFSEFILIYNQSWDNITGNVSGNAPHHSRFFPVGVKDFPPFNFSWPEKSDVKGCNKYIEFGGRHDK